MVTSEEESKYGYLLDPTFQLVNTAGKPLSRGHIEVYRAGTRDRYYCASDFDGTLLPFEIPLDSLGSNIILAELENENNEPASYDVYVYNVYGSLQMSRFNVMPHGGSSSSSGSGDNSSPHWIGVNGSPKSVFSNTPTGLNLPSGPDNVHYEGNFITGSIKGSSTKMMLNNGLYIVNAVIEFQQDDEDMLNSIEELKIYTRESSNGDVAEDGFWRRDESGPDTESRCLRVQFLRCVRDEDVGSNVIMFKIQSPVHLLSARVKNLQVAKMSVKNSRSGETVQYYPGEYISIDDYNVISVTGLDPVSLHYNEHGEVNYINNHHVETEVYSFYGLTPSYQELNEAVNRHKAVHSYGRWDHDREDLYFNKLEIRDNDEIFWFTSIKPTFNDEDRFKPSIWVQTHAFRYSLPDHTLIESFGTGVSLDNLVSSGDLMFDGDGAVTGIMGHEIAGSGGSGVQVQSDWTEADPASPAYIQNKPTIPSKTSDLINDSGFLTSVPVTGVEVNGESVVNQNGIAEITVPTSVSDLDNDLDFVSMTDVSNMISTAVPSDQVQSDWDEADVDDPAYIKNKPDLSSFATTSWTEEIVNSATSGKLDSSASGEFYPMNSNPAGYVGSDALSSYAEKSWVTGNYVPYDAAGVELPNSKFKLDVDGRLYKDGITTIGPSDNVAYDPDVEYSIEIPQGLIGSLLMISNGNGRYRYRSITNAMVGTFKWKLSDLSGSEWTNGSNVGTSNYVMARHFYGNSILYNPWTNGTAFNITYGEDKKYVNEVDFSFNSDSQVTAILGYPLAGGGGGSADYQAGDYISIENDTISVTGFKNLIPGENVNVSVSGDDIVLDVELPPSGIDTRMYTGENSINVDNYTNKIGLDSSAQEALDLLQDALPVSGIGIKIDMIDGKIVFMPDETVLWSGDFKYGDSAISLSETIANFEYIEVTLNVSYLIYRREAQNGAFVLVNGLARNEQQQKVAYVTITITGNSAEYTRNRVMQGNQAYSNVNDTETHIVKIVGINRIAGGN